MPASRAAPTGAVRDAPREGLGQTRAEGPGGAGGGASKDGRSGWAPEDGRHFVRAPGRGGPPHRPC